jgi:hypothetical protein
MAAEERGSRMQPRIEYAKAVPGAIETMQGLDAYVERRVLEPELRKLVKIRASEINGSATASTYTRRTPGREARLSSESTRSTPGTRRRSSPTGNGPLWPGPRPRRRCPMLTSRGKFTSRFAVTSPRRNWSTLPWRSSPLTGGTGSRSASGRCRVFMSKEGSALGRLEKC